MIDSTSRSTKYGKLADWLRGQINGGVLQPGDRLPSVGEMRARHDASVATVDRALGILENDGLILRVNGSGVFVAERREQSGSARPLVGLILPNCQNDFFSPIIQAVEQETYPAGYRVLIANSMGDPEREAQLLGQLVDECAGLCILPCGTGNQKAFAGLLERKRPFVLLDRMVEGLSVPLVTTDNERGGYLATRHLLEAGRERIYIVAEFVHPLSSLRERVAGYRRALTEAGIPFDPARVLQADLLPRVAGYTLTKELLREETGENPYGIFALNEATARGCYMALKEQGRKIPDEAAIVSFGDLNAAIFEPPLTAIRQDPAEMGREAARKLLDGIKGARAWKAEVIRLGVSLTVRGSSDPQSSFCSIEEMLTGQATAGARPLMLARG